MNEWYYSKDNKLLVTNENGENKIIDNIDNIGEILTVENDIEEIQINIQENLNKISNLNKKKKDYNLSRIVPNVMIIITILICLIVSNFSVIDALNSNVCTLFCPLFFLGGNIVLPCITKIIKLDISSTKKQIKYLEKELNKKEKELKDLKKKSKKQKLSNTIPTKINKSKYINNLYTNLNFIQTHIINRDCLKIFKSYKSSLNYLYSDDEIKFLEENNELLKNKKVKIIKKKK